MLLPHIHKLQALPLQFTWKTSFVLHHIPPATKPSRYPSRPVEKKRPWLCVGKASPITVRMQILLVHLKKGPETMITVKREKYQYLRQTGASNSCTALPVSLLSDLGSWNLAGHCEGWTQQHRTTDKDSDPHLLALSLSHKHTQLPLILHKNKAWSHTR